MEVTTVDDFLPPPIFEELKNLIVRNREFPLHFQSGDGVGMWDWYLTHMVYLNHEPTSKYYPQISKWFIPILSRQPLFNLRSFLRIKINCYPYTYELKEHYDHIDYGFSHVSGVFSLNTCDGFTRIGNDTKIESVENRIVFFDGSQRHNSTTTTNDFGRYNITFNFL